METSKSRSLRSAWRSEIIQIEALHRALGQKRDLGRSAAVRKPAPEAAGQKGCFLFRLNFKRLDHSGSEELPLAFFLQRLRQENGAARQQKGQRRWQREQHETRRRDHQISIFNPFLHQSIPADQLKGMFVLND